MSTSFIEDSWNEYLQFMKKVIPEKAQAKFKENKEKYIKIVLIVIAIEFVLVAGYIYQNKNVDNNIKVEKKEVYYG